MSLLTKKQEILEDFENNPKAWHIDTRAEWLASSLDEYALAIREEVEERGVICKYCHHGQENTVVSSLINDSIQSK